MAAKAPSKSDDAAPDKPKRKPRKDSQKAQSERFVETARELDADESGEAFDRAIGTIIYRRPRGS